MNRSLRIYLIALIALLVIVFIIDSSRQKPLNWYPSYMLNHKNPMDLYILNQEIDTLLSTSVTRYDKTPFEYFETQKEHKNRTYIAINEYPNFDKESWNSLLTEVQKGSTLWVSATSFPVHITDTLGLATDYKYIDTRIGTLFNKDTLRLSLTRSGWENDVCSLSPIVGQYPFSSLDTASTSVLGFSTYADSIKYISFIHIGYGNGTIYFHNQPAVFTNYSLMQKSNLSRYASRALSYIPTRQPIVWFVKGQGASEEYPQTPLSVFFKYPSLRAVWLIFIYGLILFIFFQAKRKQRVIPVIKPLQNTTVEFTQTIGNLYYQEGDVSNIVQKKIVYFLDKIRNRYYIETRQTDDAFIQKLHVKSGKDKKLIENIVHFIQWFEKNNNANEADLIRLNEFIEEFWRR